MSAKLTERRVHSTFQALPGYPWLPCPICRGTESCDHTALERARGAGHNVHPASKDKET